MVVSDSKGAPIAVGARVMIMSNWPSQIPLGHLYSRATVQRITRAGRLVLKSDVDAYGERRVWPMQVSIEGRAYDA